MNRRPVTMTAVLNFLLIALLVICVVRPVSAQKIGDVLPDPDAKPGDTSKPIKVYILAGQSNMVGMGDIAGARNRYAGIYFSNDSAVPTGPLQIFKVGNYKISRLPVYWPKGGRTDSALDFGSFVVPQKGTYRFHCGFEKTSFNVMKVEDQEVYRRDKRSQPITREVALNPGKRYYFQISDYQGETPRFWIEQTNLPGNGDLEAVVKREGKFPWLVDKSGNWTVRKDVYFQDARIAKNSKGSHLSPTSNGKSIGPELGFGHVLGTFHNEQVLLIKTAMGNRSLGFDFRPPSSGRTAPDNKFESLEYKLMIEGVRKTLTNIGKVVPGYKGQGYEIAGFVWFQGHKDSFNEKTIAEYEKNLVNLIDDVRKEFEAPKLPVVVATVGFGGDRMQEKFLRILKAQLAVGDPKQHSKFAGTVSSVDTRKYWREVDESPRSQDYHYHRNAETYMRIGDALGRAMVRLQGGDAQPLKQAARPKHEPPKKPATVSDETRKANQKALRPIVLDGIAASYAATPRNNKSLNQEASGERPQRANQFLRGSMFGLVNCYRAVGIDTYDWKSFGPKLDETEWEYFSFDPPETLPVKKGKRYRKVTYPDGMENWFKPDFDSGKAGWKKGLQPFGQLDGKLAPLSETCKAPYCGCGKKPKTLWEKEVLLVRGTFEIPPLKKGHRYRIVIGGAAHVNSGEGFAIYINGKLLAESNVGVAVRQGGQPRGAHIYKDFFDEFKGSKVTIAACSFLRYNHPRRGVQPPRGHLSLWLEEQKIPPIKTETKDQKPQQNSK